MTPPFSQTTRGDVPTAVKPVMQPSMAMSPPVPAQAEGRPAWPAARADRAMQAIRCGRASLPFLPGAAPTAVCVQK
jgi:hypothetical protein